MGEIKIFPNVIQNKDGSFSKDIFLSGHNVTFTLKKAGPDYICGYTFRNSKNEKISNSMTVKDIGAEGGYSELEIMAATWLLLAENAAETVGAEK